jgi:hypothetical protein
LHAAVRRAGAHLFFEAKNAAEKVARGANVAIEEMGNDLPRFSERMT